MMRDSLYLSLSEVKPGTMYWKSVCKPYDSYGFSEFTRLVALVLSEPYYSHRGSSWKVDAVLHNGCKVLENAAYINRSSVIYESR